MSKHEWKLGGKEVRVLEERGIKKGWLLDICKKCGVGHVMGIFTFFIPATQVQTFLTTWKRVDTYEYLPCEEEK